MANGTKSTMKVCKTTDCKRMIPKGVQGRCALCLVNQSVAMRRRSVKKQSGKKTGTGKKKKKSKIWSSKKADSEFSKWIRERDKVCYFLGCNNKATQNSHFWGRRSSATRYDPENCDGVCGGCHMKHESNKQGFYRALKINQLGQRGYDELEQRAHSTMKRRDAIIECMKLLGKL